MTHNFALASDMAPRSYIAIERDGERLTRIVFDPHMLAANFGRSVGGMSYTEDGKVVLELITPEWRRAWRP